MANFYEIVLTVLKSDERFVAEDGTFLRNAVYEAAMKMDEGLIHLLLANDETRTRFFAEVDGIKRRTLFTAKEELEITATKVGDKWHWGF